MRKGVWVVVLVCGAALWAGAQDKLLSSAAGAASGALEKNLSAALESDADLQAVERLGVAPLAGDEANLAERLRMGADKAGFNVVLIDEKAWNTLASEYERQFRREDLIKPETREKLAVQGVDALLFGTIERQEIVPVNEDGQVGRQAEVALLLEIASLTEENPGGLLWSGEIVGTSQELGRAPLQQRIVDWVQRNVLIAAVLGGVLVLMLAYWVLRQASTPR